MTAGLAAPQMTLSSVSGPRGGHSGLDLAGVTNPDNEGPNGTELVTTFRLAALSLINGGCHNAQISDDSHK